MIFLLAVATSAADRDDAQRVLRRVLELNAAAKLQSPEARGLLSGEALSHWTADSIGTISGSPDAAIPAANGSMVVRVPARAPNAEVKDFYFYLERGDGWKVSAMRTLSSVGPLYMVRDMDPASVAELPGGAYQVSNARLTLESDGELRSWFEKNQKALRRLVDLVRKSASELHRVDEEHFDSDPITRELRRLALSSTRRLPNGVEIVVGGITDNSVGFLFLSSGAPPPVSPSEYIWIEGLGSGWFLFRTT